MNILDLVLSNDPFAISDTSVGPPFSTSDHNMITFNLLNDIGPNCLVNKTYDYTKADWSKISDSLSNVDWSDVFNSNFNGDELWLSFRSVLQLHCEMYVPSVHSVANPGFKRPNNISYPAEIRKMLSLKASAWRLLRKFGTIQLKTKYNLLARECRRLIHIFIRDKEERIVHTNNLGKFYKYVNKKLSSRSGIGSLKGADGLILTRDDQKAELLNQYFISVFTIDDGIVNPIASRVHKDDTLSSIVFDPQSVFKIISSLNANSAAGPDGIKPVFLKNVAEAIKRHLAFLFECLILNGWVPTRLAQSSHYLNFSLTPISQKSATNESCMCSTSKQELNL